MRGVKICCASVEDKLNYLPDHEKNGIQCYESCEDSDRHAHLETKVLQMLTG